MKAEVYLHRSCCDIGGLLDLSKMSDPGVVDSFLHYVDWEDENLWLATLSMLLSPVFLILFIRMERSWKIVTEYTGSPRRAMYTFAFLTFVLLVYRDSSFGYVVKHQPHWYLLQENYILMAGYTLLFFGCILIYRSFKVLGFSGTFFGAELGLELPLVVKFPYSLIEHPMYVGSIMNFMGISIIFASQAGLLLTFVAAISYAIPAFNERPCQVV